MREDLLHRLETKLIADEADVRSIAPRSSDFDLNPHVDRAPRPQGLRPAAVLIPLIDYEHTFSVLLTRRADHLSSHAGQISFPGGRLDHEDETFVEAALREMEEEVGVSREAVRIAGLLEPYETVTGFCVVPVVGIVTPGFVLAIDPDEVAEAFEVPLSFLMDPANHQTHEMEFRGVPRSYYAIPFGEYYIWGATAAMLIHFYKRVFET